MVSSSGFSERQCARKVTVSAVQGLEEERVHLKGVIVDQRGQQLVLDDGTGRIPIRLPHGARAQVVIGGAATLIGSVSSFEGKKFIVADILQRIGNALWIVVHRSESEAGQRQRERQKEGDVRKEAGSPPPDSQDEGMGNARERVLSLAKRLDTGSGVMIEEMVRQSGIPGCKTFIEALLREGELFEVGPGRVKVLEG